MWLYELPERKHVPHWINLAKTYAPIDRELPDVPLALRVARAVRTMHANWEAYDAYYGRDVDYDGAETESESDGDVWETNSDDLAEDPDEEWYARKKIQ